MVKIKEEIRIEGVVDRIEDEESRVILDFGGDKGDVYRFMDTAYLREVGVNHEGQCFYLHGKEYVDGKLETWVTPIEDVPQGEVIRVDIFPDLDVSKFRR